ncbi:MAG: TIGR03752 family integrating conjugative element protein [Gammaproteobacteria bacterium]|nr:TIGR03752 family integrating conjugative element protein [Gammaproteobacteria bacterium]
MSPTKLALIALTAGGVLLGGTLLTRERAPLSAGTPREPEAPYRRGDDPSYAEELKKMTALVQDIGYQFRQAESQRLIQEEQLRTFARGEAERAQREAQQAIAKLQTALNQAMDQQTQTLEAHPTVQKLRAQIEQLTAAQTARREPAAAAEAEPAEPEGEADAAASRPEANRVLKPEGETALDRLRRELNAPDAPDAGRSNPWTGWPGLEGLTDALNPKSPAVAPPGANAPAVAGLTEPYVTLTPYVAGGSEAGRAGGVRTAAYLSAPGALAADTARWRIPRYPFTVKSSPAGATATIPVYTIPDAATLVDNATMTPLVGRVPQRGQVRDPFRFKLITGATNLASNGHRIPGIVNAVWTGYVLGVREQSCVRAYLDTVTFTFADGRLHTVNRGKGESGQAPSVKQHLGYLTDRWGKPCIRGQLFDNAGAYLKDRSVAAFLDGLAQAYAQSQVTIQQDSGVLTGYVSGDTYEYALGKGVSGATGEIADYVRERAADAFDVVYVPPGVDVQLFIETTIPIDYATDGRKLRYDYPPGGTHARLD